MTLIEILSLPHPKYADISYILNTLCENINLISLPNNLYWLSMNSLIMLLIYEYN